MSSNTVESNAHTQLLEAAINAVFDRIQQEIQINSNYECKCYSHLFYWKFLLNFIEYLLFLVQTRDFLELNSLFGAVLGRALEVLETSVIKKYTSDFLEHNGIIEVVNSNGNSYKFYAGINFCSCPSFKYDVLQHRAQYTCKHNLAARLAITLKRITEIKTSRLKFKNILEEVERQANAKTL